MPTSIHFPIWYYLHVSACANWCAQTDTQLLGGPPKLDVICAWNFDSAYLTQDVLLLANHVSAPRAVCSLSSKWTMFVFAMCIPLLMCLPCAHPSSNLLLDRALKAFRALLAQQAVVARGDILANLECEALALMHAMRTRHSLAKSFWMCSEWPVLLDDSVFLHTTLTHAHMHACCQSCDCSYSVGIHELSQKNTNTQPQKYKYMANIRNIHT